MNRDSGTSADQAGQPGWAGARPSTGGGSPVTTSSTCRFCWQPIVSMTGAGRPLWVHTGTRLASCAGGLPIAEPNPAAPAVQAALFDLPSGILDAR